MGRRRRRSVGRRLWSLGRPALFALAALWAGAAGATHYPPGAACYDCHAVSGRKTIPGTHLIRASARATELGITSSATIRCLFCHDTAAVSLTSRTEMRDVRSHFGSASLSKHRVTDAVALASGTTDFSSFEQKTDRFDCLDCHVGITGVAYNPSRLSDPDIHGVDASALNPTLVYSKLVGVPADDTDATISGTVCRNAVCHDEDGGPNYGPTDPPEARIVPPKLHGYAKSVSLNDVAGTPANCLSCHGKHNSADGTSILTLKNTSGADGTAATNATVQPGECEVCHTQDDAGRYAAGGHGQTTINGGTLRCTNCHTTSVAHGFSRSAPKLPPPNDTIPVNPDRFGFAEGTVQSDLTHKSSYSVCLACHSIYDGYLHSLGGKKVGCIDCHEPHGTGTGANLKMVRGQVPADYTNDTTGAVEATTDNGAQSTIQFQSANDYAWDMADPATVTRAVCDNRDCHGGVDLDALAPKPAIYPMSPYLATAGAHTGDVITSYPVDCSTCHSHTDPLGAWKASASCTKCHGMPPDSRQTSAPNYGPFDDGWSPHALHAKADGYAFSCKVCHSAIDVHNTAGWNPTTNTWAKSPDLATYRDVVFGTDAADGNPYNQATASYDAVAYACSNLYCHSDGTSRTATNATAVAWQSVAAPTNWSATNLSCAACHKGIGTGARIATGSHAAHLALAGVTCKTCHSTTIGTMGSDTTTTIADRTTHVNGLKNAAPDGTQSYAGRVVSFSHADSSGSCSSISCHNGKDATWGTPLSCDDCHANTAGDRDDYVYGNGTFAEIHLTEWEYSGHGRSLGTGYDVSNNPQGNFGATAADDPEGCAYCHAFQSTQTYTVAHGDDSNPFRLVNRGALRANTSYTAGNEDMSWNDVCLVCHGSTSRWPAATGYDPDGAGASEYSSHNGKDVDENHYGSKHDRGEGGQYCWDCHDPHGDRLNSSTGNIYMIQRQVALANDGTADGASGVPIVAQLKSVTFTTRTPPVGVGFYTELAGVSPHVGVCQACHNPSSSNPTKFWRWDGTDDPDGPGGAAPVASGSHEPASQCTTCHAHAEDFKGTCTSCHGNSTAGNWWPDSTVENGTVYPNRAGDHQQHIDAIYVRNSATLPGVTVVEKKNATCQWCHPMASAAWPTPNHSANAGTGKDANTADVAMDGWNQTTHFKRIDGVANGVVTDAYDNAALANGKRCSNVDCHYRVATPTTGAPTASGDGWYNPAAAATCSNCHGDGSAGAALPNAHGAHVNAYTAAPPGKQYACTQCHPNQVGNPAHQNGGVDFDFSQTSFEPGLVAGSQSGSDLAVKFGGAGAYATCNNFACHGVELNNGGTDQTPVWNDYTTGDCGTCHGINADAAALGRATFKSVNSANHYDHFFLNQGPKFPDDHASTGCFQCHPSVVVANRAAACGDCHPSRWDPQLGAFSMYGARATGATQPTPGHVDGKVDFGNTVTTTFATSELGAGAGPATAANTDRCDNCHSTGIAGGQTESGVVQAKARWSDAAVRLACVTCHNQAAAAWSKADGPLSTDPKVQAPAKDGSYLTTGHGRPVGNYGATGNPPANLLCTTCHEQNAPHFTHALNDDDRLKPVADDGLTYTTTTSNLCGDCHKPGAGAGTLGVNAASEASVHSGGVTGKFNTSVLAANAFPAYGETGNYAANPGYQCDACHDPHGTSKVAMLLPEIDGRLGGVSNPRPVGVGLDAASATDLRGLDPLYQAAGAVPPDDGVCDVCHRAGALSHPDTGVEAGNHNQGGTGASCMTCHDHTKSFQGSCTGCHGNTTAGNWWPDNTAEHGPSYPNRLGDHLQHVDAVAVARYGASPTMVQKNSTCDTCHPNPGSARAGTSETSHNDNVPPVDVHGDGRAGAAASNFKTVAGATQAVQGTHDNSAAAGGKTCATVDCHYRIVTPTTGTPTADGDGWYQPLAQATCSNCHGSATAGAALPNAHPLHVGATPAAYAFSCVQCHPSYGTNMSHQNGVLDVVFTATLDPAVGGPRDETYTGGTTAVKYGVGTFGQCNALYCHGNRAGGNASNAPRWGTPTDADCGTCHGSTLRTGTAVDKAWPNTGSYAESHGDHVGSNSQPGCSACHEAAAPATVALGTYGDPTKHVNGAIEQVFGSAIGETATVDYEGASTLPSYSQTLRTCADVRCHNGASTPAFNLSGGVNIDCGDCHGTFTTSDPTPASATTAGSHARHASPTDFTTCDNCHGDATYSVTAARGGSAYTAQGGGGASPSGIHQNLAVNMYMNVGSGTYVENYTGKSQTGAGGVDWVAGTETPPRDDGQCSASGCHGSAQPFWGGTITGGCYACHDTNGATVGENGGALGGASDRSPNEVDKGQYDSTGHGLTSGRYGKDTVGDGAGNTAANVTDCYLCHSSAVAHAPQTPSTDPFRLGANASNPSNVCLSSSCHGPDLPGLINHHNDNVINNANTSYDFDVKCVDCHDPHGDTNLFMVHSRVAVASEATGSPKTPSDTYGVPDTTSPVVFTKDTVGSDFAHTSTSYTGPFTGICEVCHVNTRWYRGTTVGSLNGPRPGHDFVDTCINCHTHKEGFKGGGCDGCHGFPPVDQSQTPVARTNTFGERLGTFNNDPANSYTTGGGVHRVHVNFLWKKLDAAFDPTSASASPVVEVDPKVLCGPCHGDGPGSAGWHNNDTAAAGKVRQSNVDIRNRSGLSSVSWGTGAKYDTIDMSSTTASNGGAVSSGNSQVCSNLDCHGRPDPAKVAANGTKTQSEENQRAHFPESLKWTDVVQTATDGTGDYVVSKRSVVCKWCHDETPARIVVKNGALSADLYDSDGSTSDGFPTSRAATAFFRPLSGYSRGGHGDGLINATSDPSFVDSASGSTKGESATPVPCDRCHDDRRVGNIPEGLPSVAHFPPPALTSNGHRLTNTTIEDNAHTGGLCADCHAGSDYPGSHHPSLYGPRPGKTPDPGDIIPGATRIVRSPATTWASTGSIYEQNGYLPVDVAGQVDQPGDPDVFIDWWGGAFGTSFPSTPPMPNFYGVTGGNPKAILPLEGNVIGGNSERVMCVTCHNPHGTDLFTYDPGGGHESIPDNNMLRVRDQDNSLCNACH